MVYLGLEPTRANACHIQRKVELLCDRIQFCNVLKQNECIFACLNTKISKYVVCIKNKKNIMKFGICKGYKDLDVRKCMKVGSRHQCIVRIKFNGIKSSVIISNDIKSKCKHY